MRKQPHRKKSGSQRRPLHETEKFRERMLRSQAEYTEAPPQVTDSGVVITGPISIADLMRSHGQELKKSNE
jgi:hypothetical protein